MTYELMPILVHMGACQPARDWLTCEKRATFAEAWEACESPAWMCWLLGRTVSARTIVLVACRGDNARSRPRWRGQAEARDRDREARRATGGRVPGRRCRRDRASLHH